MRSPILSIPGMLCLCQLVGGCQPVDRSDPSDEKIALDATAEDVGQELHERMVVLDSHAGFSGDPLRSCGETGRQVDFSKMRRGGLDAVFFTVWTPPGVRTDDGYAEASQLALQRFREIHDLVDGCSEDVALAREPDDVREIVEEGKLAVAIGVEGGFVIGEDLTLLERYAELGMAYLGLTWNGHNAIADAAIPLEELGDSPSEHGGVSSFGARVISELNRLGVMIDVSHLSNAATRDAIRLSRAPAIASHSSMFGIVPHLRNIDDEAARALAEKGGVVQITAVHEFVKVDPPGAMDAFYSLLDEFGLESGGQAVRLPPDRRAQFEERLEEQERRWALASVVHLVDHIDYAVGLVGVDHVGIGSDFEGGAGLRGWADATETSNVTLELLRRGYTEEEIQKIWGGNLLRVWTAVRSMAAVG